MAMRHADTNNQQPKHQDSEQPKGVFMTGLCAGAAVGAGLALLFAPRTGLQLRAQLTDTAARAAAAVSGTVEALAHRGERIATQANGAASTPGDEMERPANSRAHSARGLATLGEITASHGGDWRSALRG
jgi:gas vesicle protein